ncbi:MAG: adenylyltransferase/cytidyltransferase family protein [Verrucomicrobia bacterium]|nr:adenylyltransferase/cytidyltransferase family protein [Verrucomicrobiota bacterium]MBU1734406.1 adenylyltransferase/cytidyltransferase family protein [Verrucomicrobiota bacterium]MBU1855694.1 adenylyltransferase/cytidyltransferase family protein [Verrucomicrobiota bacterium]
MHSRTYHSKLKIIPTDQWQAWRKNIADAGGTLAVVTGSFAIWHPGNLAAIQEAARHASHVCVIITPAIPTAPGTDPDMAIPSAALRAEMATYLRVVSLATACPPGKAKEVFARLRPYTLVECTAQKIPGTVATVARNLAGRVVDLSPIAGCFTADIQKAIQYGRTPVSVPDAVMAPQPTRHDLDRFLDTSPGRPLVTVNGCFDVLHLGHVQLLAQASNLGARLLVLVNDDDSVRTYKGAGRPIFPIRFRLHALNALDAVAMAYPFAGDNPLPLLATIRPDIHVKGGSFEETRVREEKHLVESWGGRLEIIPLVEGFSTSNVVSRMAGR